MKEKKFVLNVALTAVVFLAVLTAVLLRTFAPGVVIPRLGIPELTLLSLAALVADHYLAPGAKRSRVFVPVLSLLTFSLLPLCAGLVAPLEALWLGVRGCLVFTVTTVLYTSIQERLSSGPAAKLAPILSAFCLYLASQAFMGI